MEVALVEVILQIISEVILWITWKSIYKFVLNLLWASLVVSMGAEGQTKVILRVMEVPL